MDPIEYTTTELHGQDVPCLGSLADLILDANLIPLCGLVPPFRVVAAVFLTGGLEGGMSSGCCWQPFELGEEDYWQAVEQLVYLTPADLTCRHRDPHIVGAIRPDYEAPDTDDYLVWFDSLIQRGLMGEMR